MKAKSPWLLLGLLIGTLSFFSIQNVGENTDDSNNISGLDSRPIEEKILSDLNNSSSSNSIALGRGIYEPAVLGAQAVVENLQPDNKTAPADIISKKQADLISKKQADLLNKKRIDSGLKPLILSESLSASAKKQADGNQSNISQIAESEGYKNWEFLSFNIISGMNSLEDAVKFWMTSPSHRDNILSEKPTEYGVGHNGTTWVVVFGTRQP